MRCTLYVAGRFSDQEANQQSPLYLRVLVDLTVLQDAGGGFDSM